MIYGQVDKTIATWQRTAPGTGGEWKLIKKVIGGSGWDRFERIIAGPDGRIYAIDGNGSAAERGLWRYRWNGSDWDTSLGGGKQGVRISEGFGLYTKPDFENRITIDEAGDIYVIDDGGRVRMYRFNETTKDWAIDGRLIDTGFGAVNLLASGGVGVLYARSNGNRLYRLWYDAVSHRWTKDYGYSYKGLGNLASILPVGGGVFYAISNKEINDQPAGSLFQFQAYEAKVDATLKLHYVSGGGGWNTIPNATTMPTTCRPTGSVTPAPVPVPAAGMSPVSVVETPSATNQPSGTVDITFSEQVTGLRHCRVVAGTDQPAACPVLTAQNDGVDVAFTGQPALAVTGKKLVQIVAHSRANGHLWAATQQEQSSNTWNMADIGGRFAGRPEVVTLTDGSLVYLSLDDQGALWYRRQDGREGDLTSWQVTKDTRRFAVTPVGAALDGEHVFLLGYDDKGGLLQGRLHTGNIDAGTVTWSSLGAGTFVGEPSIVRLSGQRFRLFARTEEGAIVTQANDIGKPFPNAWSNVGGFVAGGSPAGVIDMGNSRFAVLARNPENKIFYSYETAPGAATWGPWTELVSGGEPVDPAAVDLTVSQYSAGNDPRWIVSYRNQNGALRLYERRLVRSGGMQFVPRPVPANVR